MSTPSPTTDKIALWTALKITVSVLYVMEAALNVFVIWVYTLLTTERDFFSLILLVGFTGAARTFFSELHNTAQSHAAARKAALS